MRTHIRAMLKILLVLLGLCLLIGTSASAQDQNTPFVGEEFDYLLSRQYASAQAMLMLSHPDSAGYRVSGPLPIRSGDEWPFGLPFTKGPFVVCLTAEAYDAVELRSIMSSRADWFFMPYRQQNDQEREAGATPRIASVGTFNASPDSVLGIAGYGVVTLQQLRGLIWASWQDDPFSDEMQPYLMAVQDYLAQLDQGNLEAEPPKAVDFGLSEDVGLFAEPPDYVIPGYENYMNYLHSHAAIDVEFASGVLAVVPSDSLMSSWKADAPQAAFPNKEWPMLQKEYKKFFDRAGDHSVMQTLTREGFDTLAAGEYFFGVSPSGFVRMGRELLRAEVDRIEQETGRKVPRANHAFLFPGEPLLTAGAFFVEIEDGKRKLTEVNAQSGHYFYSNVSSTIREDIAESSDDYFLTLAHFFKALDSLDIPYDHVLVSKL